MGLPKKETPSCYGANIEIQCLLHTRCNLRCKFCFETKSGGIRENSKINLDYIHELPNIIESTIVPRYHRKTGIVEISMMGGELFSDDIPDEIFKEYEQFATSMKDMIHRNYPEVTIRFKCLSNGVYQNLDRVTKFLDTFQSKIILSYDPVDRFSCNRQKEMWFNTFQYFKSIEKYKLTLSIVLTKKTIEKYVSDDIYFLKLGNMIYTDTNIYVPRLDYQEYLPSDDDLFQFFLWCIKHRLFNVSTVHNLFIAAIHGINTSSCGSKSDFIFGEDFLQKYNEHFVNKCTEESPISKEEYYGIFAKDIKDVCGCAQYKRPLGLQKRGCLYCEHFKYCPKMCWTQILFQYYPLMECPFKRTIEYIRENRAIQNQFEEWRKEYDQYHTTL